MVLLDVSSGPGTLYDRCARALEKVRVDDSAMYAASFGLPSAMKAAEEIHALRYASPNDERPAMAYGPSPVVSIVACLLDETSPTDTPLPRLIDREAIKTVTDLQPIVLATSALFGAR
jgi:hypothetical protein